MNDRFLYRAICNDGKFHHGYLARLYKDEGYGKKGDFCISNSSFCPYAYLVTRPETIGQCTGLKDKNGKLIYEDDIVRWSLCRGDGDICENYQIIWRDNCAAFGCLKSNGDILDMFSQPELKAKVIGNVHENPDLLESEE